MPICGRPANLTNYLRPQIGGFAMSGTYLRNAHLLKIDVDRAVFLKHTQTVFIPHTVCKKVDFSVFRLFSISNIGIDFGIPSFGCHFSQEIRFPANFPYFSHVVFHGVR